MQLRISASILVFAVVIACGLLTPPAFSQTSAEARQTGAILVQLSSPMYPRLAQQARISGDVTVMLAIRPDGSVESAMVVSGHPMLKQAALESAEKSRFQCEGCSGVTSYLLTYTFEIAGQCHETLDCSSFEWPAPRVRQSLSYVTVTVDPVCTCDPTAAITRIKWRSAKCFYLWHCASRVTDVK